MPDETTRQLHVLNNVAVWSGGAPAAEVDLWFLPAFADSHLCFREVFNQPIARAARIFLFDPPGFGASPARDGGLTVETCARLLAELITHFRGPRAVVLVAHSMAGIIATQVVRRLDLPPALIASIEGNLSAADAYLTGQAADYEKPEDFYATFAARILDRVRAREIPERFYASLLFADPVTLWVLGRSVLEYAEPGEDFKNLRCPTVYYWDPSSTTAETQRFLSDSGLHQRQLDGLGHWPMVRSPQRFYAALHADVLAVV